MRTDTSNCIAFMTAASGVVLAGIYPASARILHATSTSFVLGASAWVGYRSMERARQEGRDRPAIRISGALMAGAMMGLSMIRLYRPPSEFLGWSEYGQTTAWLVGGIFLLIRVFVLSNSQYGRQNTGWANSGIASPTYRLPSYHSVSSAVRPWERGEGARNEGGNFRRPSYLSELNPLVALPSEGDSFYWANLMAWCTRGQYSPAELLAHLEGCSKKPTSREIRFYLGERFLDDCKRAKVESIDTIEKDILKSFDRLTGGHRLIWSDDDFKSLVQITLNENDEYPLQALRAIYESIDHWRDQLQNWPSDMLEIMPFHLQAELHSLSRWMSRQEMLDARARLLNECQKKKTDSINACGEIVKADLRKLLGNDADLGEASFRELAARALNGDDGCSQIYKRIDQWRDQLEHWPSDMLGEMPSQLQRDRSLLDRAMWSDSTMQARMQLYTGQMMNKGDFQHITTLFDDLELNAARQRELQTSLAALTHAQALYRLHSMGLDSPQGIQFYLGPSPSFSDLKEFIDEKKFGPSEVCEKFFWQLDGWRRVERDLNVGSLELACKALFDMGLNSTEAIEVCFSDSSLYSPEALLRFIALHQNS